MRQVTATLSSPGGAVLQDGAAAFVHVGNRGELSGHFFAPADSPIQVGGRYRLRTGDGRSGDILVTGTSDAGGEQRVTFMGFLPGG